MTFLRKDMLGPRRAQRSASALQRVRCTGDRLMPTSSTAPCPTATTARAGSSRARYHRLPEARMLERHQLSRAGKAGQRLGLPGRVVGVDQVDAARRQHEEAAVDPAAVATRLFREATYDLAVQGQRAVASRRLDRGDRGEPAVLAMKARQGADVDVGHAVAVGE